MSAAHLWTALPGLGGRRRRNGKCSNLVSSVFSCAVAAPVTSSNERVDEVVLKQAALVREERWELKSRGGVEESVKDASLLNVAYDRCGEVCAEYAKTFYMGTSFIWILDSASNVVTVLAFFWCSTALGEL